MDYEVEQKHRVDDAAQLTERLSDRGASFGETIQQTDQYFAHPCRDFAETDEALRIRTVGERSFVTYKGPKLDRSTKTRRELELPLDPQDADGSRLAELFIALGFTPVAAVHKTRRPFQLSSNERVVEGAIDEVEGLDLFVELELTANDANLDESKRIIAALAAELQLGPAERRSYLEMLLERQTLGPDN